MNLVGVGGKLYNFAKSALLLAVELLCRRGANSRADGELGCPLFAKQLYRKKWVGVFSSGGESKSRFGVLGECNFALLQTLKFRHLDFSCVVCYNVP